MNGTDLSQLFNLDKLLLGTSLSPLQIILSLSVTLAMTMFIYFIYKKTYNGVLYSKNFNVTLVMVALAINAIIIGISGNIVLSLGLVGALSIIRFRTAVKDPRDTGFIFWAMTVGLVNGVGYYELSLITTIFIAAVVFVMSRNITWEPSYMLIIKFANDDTYDAIEPILKDKKLLISYFTRSDSRKASGIEKVIEIKINREQQEKLLRKIRSVEGVESCDLLSSNGEFTE